MGHIKDRTKNKDMLHSGLGQTQFIGLSECILPRFWKGILESTT